LLKIQKNKAMKKIFLLLVALFAFLTASLAQITQVESDSIVLERMQTETRQYTVSAQKRWQTKDTIATLAGEVLELNYPCWGYYVNFVEEANSNRNHYLVVRESDGNVLEVNTKNDAIPNDLAAWRAVKLIDIPITEYVLDGSSCQCADFQSDTIIVINSAQELENYLQCTNGNYPAIDFTQNSLLLVRGRTVYGSIADISKNLVQLSPDNYKLRVGIQLSDTADSQEWLIAMLTPKLNNVALYLYYPHIEVWECFFEEMVSNPDVTITLTLDTLLKKFHVNTIPQVLYFEYKTKGSDATYKISFFFQDGQEGKYSEYYDYFYALKRDFISFDYGERYLGYFMKTILSPDSMLLRWSTIVIPTPSRVQPVLNYSFIKQN
jgi:hypothetical protein